MISFTRHSEKAHLQGQRTDQWLPGRGGEAIKKWHVGNFEGDETVLYLDCGRAYMTVYICQTHRSMHKKGECIPQEA